MVVLQLGALVVGLMGIGFLGGYYTRARLSARRRRSKSNWRASVGGAS